MLGAHWLLNYVWTIAVWRCSVLNDQFLISELLVNDKNFVTLIFSCCIFQYYEAEHVHISVQIFEEEHNVWFLDKGGALLAVPSVPTRHLWYVH